jgi:diguanylate cyclase (GGDEF)-like protein
MGFGFLRGREFRLLLLMCGLVFACASGSQRISSDAGGISCIWIANGIISAFVLTAPPSWKARFFVAGQVVSLLVDVMMGSRLVFACWFAICNSSEVLITVLPLGHFAGRAEVNNQRNLARIAYFGVFLGPLAGAALGAPAVSILDGRSGLEIFRLWFLSGSLGSAASLFSTLLLLTTENRRHSRTMLARLMRVFAWGGPLVAITAAIFWQTKYPIVFLLFPPLTALLFRFKLAGSVFGASLVVILGAVFTAEGHGPFRLFPGDPPMEQVTLFHMFGLVLFATSIAAAFHTEERFRLARELKAANGKLSELAFRDGLTGVLNRRSFDDILESAWTSAANTAGNLSLLYLDIDFFKRFNDTYGHQTGDDCLRRVALALVDCVREFGDCVARYGGEEFVIVLPDVSESSIRNIAERIADTIVGLEIRHKESPFGVISASFGVATLCPSAGGAPSELIHLADSALYRAKRRGRNRIEVGAQIAAPECVLA